MSKLNLSEKVSLIVARTEIVKLKADDYNWQVHVPDAVKEQLEQTIKDIDDLLESDREAK